MNILATFILALSWGLPIDALFPQTPLTAKTDPPMLLQEAGEALAMTEEEYSKMVGAFSKMPNFVGVKQKPKELSANARFGFNLSFGGFNRSWVLDGNSKDGYVLYADLNANGDLTDDSPLRLENYEGKHSVLLNRSVTESVNGKDESYSLQLKLEVGHSKPRDKSEPQLALKIYSDTRRNGSINVAGKDVIFALVGSQGIYNWDYNRVYFDLNSDRILDMVSPKSLESYQVQEKYVNLAGVSYEFMVDRYGRSLTLKPLAEKLPDRAVLRPGSRAPEFSVTDIHGKTHSLSDYRGSVVLIDFWGIWCTPCVAEVPKLVAVYKKLHGNGFEIIGVHLGRDVNARKFIKDRGMNWTHVLEEKDGALNSLFRVDRWPTYYLIGRDGVILANELRPGEQLIKEVEKAFKDD